MGEHKRNEIAKLAKEGKAELKKPKIGKRQFERELFRTAQDILFKRFGIIHRY